MTVGCDLLQPAPDPIPEQALTAVFIRPSATGEWTATPWPTVTRSGPTWTSAPSFTPSPTSTPVVCTETQGTIVQASFLSAITGLEFHYRVSLPPCYAASGRRYPVLILLHGFDPASDSMNDDQWDRLGVDEIAVQSFLAGQIAPMIVVMPNGNDAYYGDDTSDSPFPQVVATELIPWIDVQYCTWSDAAHRAIGGLSRGGYWAYYIAFRFPELFSRVGGHSPYFYAPMNATSANPVNLLDAAGIETLSMYFDYGVNDYASVASNTGQFVRRLEERGIIAQYVINDDSRGHTESYWSAHLADYLAFYSAAWPLDVSGYPLCAKSP